MKINCQGIPAYLKGEILIEFTIAPCLKWILISPKIGQTYHPSLKSESIPLTNPHYADIIVSTVRI